MVATETDYTDGTYWDIDGVSLHTLGWSVTTLGGTRNALPTLRGDDIQLAYRPGTFWRPKVADARTITLLMWMQGVHPSTGHSPVSIDMATQFTNNWVALKKLFWKPNGAQVTLTRRERRTINGVSTVVTMSAKAQIAGTMEPTATGKYRYTFSVDLLLADPFYYGPVITVPLPLNTVVTVNNPGDDVAAWSGMSLQLYGPLALARVTNYTPDPNVWVQAGTVGSGSITLDMDAYTVTPSSFGLAKISHSGARSWFGLLPGNNTVQLTGSGSGQAVLRFQAPYL